MGSIEDAEELLAIQEKRDAIAIKERLALEAMTFKERLEAEPERLERLYLTQKETFEKMIKRDFGLLITETVRLFEEYFKQLLDEKVKNMRDYMIKKGYTQDG